MTYGFRRYLRELRKDGWWLTAAVLFLAGYIGSLKACGEL